MITDRLLSVHSCYDLNPFCAFRTLSLIAYVTYLPCPAPARTVPDGSRNVTIHASVMHRDVVIVPTSDGRTSEVAVSNDPAPISRCSFDLLFYHPDLIEFAGQAVYNMLSLLNLCTDAHNQIMVRMPSFIADVVEEAWRRGFSELVVHAYVIQAVPIYQDCNIQEAVDVDCEDRLLLDAAMYAGAIEVAKVKGEEAGEVCAVCLDEFLEGMDASRLALCSHVFHSDCIGRWLVQSLRNGRHGFRCPICRSTVELQ